MRTSAERYVADLQSASIRKRTSDPGLSARVFFVGLDGAVEIYFKLANSRGIWTLVGQNSVRGYFDKTRALSTSPFNEGNRRPTGPKTQSTAARLESLRYTDGDTLEGAFSLRRSDREVACTRSYLRYDAIMAAQIIRLLGNDLWTV